jgi:hypothetical protein
MRHRSVAGLVRVSIGGLAVAAMAGALAFAVPGGGVTPARGSGAAVASRAPRAGVARSYGDLPLSFEPNVGQTDPGVRFLSRGAGYTLFVTPDQAVLALRSRSSAGNRALPASAGDGTASGSRDVLSMRLRGAAGDASITGIRPLAGVSSSFIGDDPNNWHTNIRTYAGVLERNVYPGVDLAYYGNQGGRLEYDFTVAPGVDPAVIRLAFGGHLGLSVDGAGDLILRLPHGDVMEPHPTAYQVVGGSRRRVAVSFALRGRDVGFTVGARDVSLPLVIDPVISYSTYIGGTDFDEINGIVIDAHRDAYLFGDTSSDDFPLKSCIFCTFKGGAEDNSDDFVAKMNSTGTALMWSTYLGGTGDDEAEGLAIDHEGNAYVAGPTLSFDFPTTPGAFQEDAPGGDHDGYVTKIDSNGSSLVYSTYLGGSEHDATIRPIVNSAGDVYVIGDTASTDLPVTRHAFQKHNHGGDCTIFNEFDPGDCEESGGGLDTFVAELNPTLSDLIYLTYLGGTGDDVGLGFDVDSSGNAYVALETTSTDYPVTRHAFQRAFAGGDGSDGVNSDNVVTKLSPSGSKLVYSTYLGGTGDDCFAFRCHLDVDGQGHAFLASDTTSTDFPTTRGAFQTSNRGGFDQTVTKLNAKGTGLVYSTYLGGTGDDRTGLRRAIVVRPNGWAYVAGFTDSQDYPTVDPIQGSFAGVTDVGLSVLDRKGSSLLFSTYLGGSDEEAAGLALDDAHAVYVAGYTCSTDYPVTMGAFQTSMAGVCDGMVTKILLGDAAGESAVDRGKAAPSGHLSPRWWRRR